MERNQLTLLICLHFHVDTLHLGVKTVKKIYSQTQRINTPGLLMLQALCY